MARLIDADEIMREAEHISTFRCNLAGLSDLAILLSGANTIDPVKQGWISVKDGLPTEEDSTSGMVLAVENDEERHVKPWHWEIVRKYATEFTHWMPLPEPPKEGE